MSTQLDLPLTTLNILLSPDMSMSESTAQSQHPLSLLFAVGTNIANPFPDTSSTAAPTALSTVAIVCSWSASEHRSSSGSSAPIHAPLDPETAADED